MTLDKDKPYVLRVAELIYSSVVNIKKENPGMTNIQAFEVFMTTKDYDLISSGEFHNQWILELKNNSKDKNTEVKDCFETVNRGIFAFNQGLDKIFFKPILLTKLILAPKPIT